MEVPGWLRLGHFGARENTGRPGQRKIRRRGEARRGGDRWRVVDSIQAEPSRAWYGRFALDVTANSSEAQMHWRTRQMLVPRRRVNMQRPHLEQRALAFVHRLYDGISPRPALRRG